MITSVTYSCNLSQVEGATRGGGKGQSIWDNFTHAHPGGSNSRPNCSYGFLRVAIHGQASTSPGVPRHPEFLLIMSRANTNEFKIFIKSIVHIENHSKYMHIEILFRNF